MFAVENKEGVGRIVFRLRLIVLDARAEIELAEFIVRREGFPGGEEILALLAQAHPAFKIGKHGRAQEHRAIVQLRQRIICKG